VVPDDQYWLALVAGEAGDDRVVISKPAIPADLREFRKQPADVIQDRRPVGMTGDEDALPWRQGLVDICSDGFDLCL